MNTWKHQAVASPIHSRCGLWCGLLVQFEFSRNASDITSPNRLCCFLLCPISYLVAAGAKAIDTGKDTKEAAQTGVDDAQTGGNISYGPSDGLPSTYLWILNIKKYKLPKGEPLRTSMVAGTGSDGDHRRRQILETGEEELILIGHFQGPLQPSSILPLPQPS